MGEISEALQANPDQAVDQLERRLSQLASTRKEVDELRQKLSSAGAADLVASAQELPNGVKSLVVRHDAAANPKELQRIALDLRGRLDSAVVALGANFDGKASLVATVSKSLQSQGLSAAEVVRDGAKLVGGGTGKNADVAMAGGSKGNDIDAALALCQQYVQAWTSSAGGSKTA